MGAADLAQARAMMNSCEAIIEALFAAHQRARTLLFRHSRVIAA